MLASPKSPKVAQHLANAWVYKQQMRAMVAELARGEATLTNQYLDNFLVFIKMREDELEAAQK